MNARMSYDALKTYYVIPSTNIVKRALFPLTKSYTDVRVEAGNWSLLSNVGWSKWDKVADQLFLGKIPDSADRQRIIDYVNKANLGLDDEDVVQESSHASDSTSSIAPQLPTVNYPLGLVVSTVDYFELAGSFPLNAIATPKEWLELGVKNCHVPIKDFKSSGSAHNECIIKAVYEMREHIEKGFSVYVHCKAGRGRSTMLCVIYLAIFGQQFQSLSVSDAFDEALRFVTANRHHVELDETKSEKAKEVITKIRELQLIDMYRAQPDAKDKKIKIVSESSEEESLELAIKQGSLRERLDAYCGSMKFKLAVIEMIYFKELAIHAAYCDPFIGRSVKTDMIRDFFNDIYNANNSDFLSQFVLEDSSVSKFIAGDPQPSWSPMSFIQSYDGDAKTKVKRKELIESFFLEIVRHLSAELGCSFAMIRTEIDKRASVYSTVEPVPAHSMA